MKKTELIAIFLTQLVLLSPFYALDSFGITISRIDAISPSPNSAIISWITDKNTTGAVVYEGHEKGEIGYLTNHSISIDGLVSEQRYNYYVKSCNASGFCATSSNLTFVAGSDSVAVLSNISIPRYTRSNTIDISGTTKPYSTVILYVNDFGNPKRVLSGAEVSSGRFVFSQIQLAANNQIRIVARDRAGNENEKLFEVTVDPDNPVVRLNNISKYISRPNLTISGAVNELVTVSIFSESDSNETEIPSKISNLSTTKVDKNAVEIKWTESKDAGFSHYAIFRNGIAIALARPSSFTLFTDALVDSGKTYTYEVSAVDRQGNEGQKSDVLTVRTLDGGSTLNLNYPPVNIFEDFRKPIAQFNASGEFSHPIKLGKDGTYELKISFKDKAGNEVIIEKTVILDTKRPVIRISSPHSGAFVYENMAAEVDVIGTTEPNSKVHLYIDRHPFPNFNQTVELSGLPNDLLPTLDNIPEFHLDAKCRLNLGGKEYCGNSADRSTVSDSSGNFRFENVDLSVFLGQATRINEVPLTEFNKVQLNQDSKEAKSTTLLIIATDPSGLRNFAKNTIKIGNCYSGNFSFDLIPLTEFQSPTFLSPERLAEGTEALYFYYNLSYIGRGTNVKDIKVHIGKACSEKGLMDSRFNVSCSLFRGASSIAVNRPENTVWYSTVQLARTPGMEMFLEDDWKSFIKAINNELSFPLLVTISYKHTVIDDSGVPKEVTEVQRTCDQVSYVLDNTLIDPRTVLPDWLLYDFVEYLQNSVKVLSEVQEHIDRLIDYVGQACLWTYLAHTVYKIYRTWVDLSNERLSFLTGIQKTEEWNQKCQPKIDAIVAKHGKPFRLRYMSDPDLKECFPSSYSAWKKEEKFYEWQRWSCDRIFGHSAPSRWTENREDKELQKKRENEAKCESDNSVQGQPLRADKCSTFADKYPGARNFGVESKCVLVRVGGTRERVYVIGNLVSGSTNLYELKWIDATERESETIHALRDSGNENYFLTARPKTCREICGVSSGTKTRRTVTSISGKPIQLKPSLNVAPKKDGVCLTTNECKTIASEKVVLIDQVALKAEYVNPRGYTSDCFYEPDDPERGVEVVSDNPETREECCCINSEGIEDYRFYQPDDVSLYDGKPVHESKGGANPTPKENDPKGYTDIDFSYRYQRIRFEAKGNDANGFIHNKYHPDRYIDGRDVYACFGQDSLLHSALGKKEEVLVLNPFKQHLSAMQCAYLTGINQRLRMLSNIMTSMSNCLIEVRQSGRADSGVCKELFTQHVCGAIWQAVRFFIDGCSPDNIDVDVEKRDDGMAEKLRLGLRGIANGISESQQEISEEYGNAKLNNLLGIGDGGVARKACLAAFGYDWDLSAKNLVDAAYTAPFATLVQPVTRSREYLTVDPITLRAKYEYRSSWFINPGCDIENYKVDLVCVGQKEINENPEVDCGDVGAASIAYAGTIGTSTEFNNCDCKDLPEGKSTSFYGSSQRLKQNVPEEKDHHKVIDDHYRYDHLRFTLRTDRRIPANIRQNCFPPGYEDGVFYRPIIDKTARDIADCSVNYLSGVYSCKGGAAYVGQKGIVQVDEITLNGENALAKEQLQFQVGEDLGVGLSLTKTGKDKCVRLSLHPDPIQPKFEEIVGDGQVEVPEIKFTDSLQIASTAGNVIQRDLAIKLRSQNNDEPVNINLLAKDNPLGYNSVTQNIVGVYSSDDTVIIDGIQVDLISGSTYSNGQTSVRLEEPTEGNVKKIVVSKANAEIEINNIVYQKNADGEEYRNQQVITVNPPQQAGATTQQKTLAVEIFNLKDTSDSFITTDDCNINDKIYDKQIKFTVTQKGADTSELGPSIGSFRTSARSPITIGNEVTVSTRVTHRQFVRSVTISIADQNGRKIPGSDNQPMTQNGDTYTHTFSTTGLSPGRYTINVIAAASNGKTSTKTGNFELRERTQSGGTTTFAAPTSSTFSSSGSSLGTTGSLASTTSFSSAVATVSDSELMGIGVNGLRPDVQQAFNSMKAAAAADGVTLSVIPGSTSFDDQLRIWNSKFSSLPGTTEQKIANAAAYSAIPGLSRHHFGTEIDVNSVNPADFSSGGKYFGAYSWLLSNADKFRFCQPYDSDRLVKTEPWHWSYKPISSVLSSRHISQIGPDDISGKGILGESSIIQNFETYQKGFISDVNPQCA